MRIYDRTENSSTERSLQTFFIHLKHQLASHNLPFVRRSYGHRKCLNSKLASSSESERNRNIIMIIIFVAIFRPRSMRRGSSDLFFLFLPRLKDRNRKKRSNKVVLRSGFENANFTDFSAFPNAIIVRQIFYVRSPISIPSAISQQMVTR